MFRKCYLPRSFNHEVTFCDINDREFFFKAFHPRSQGLSSSHKREWSITPSRGKTKDPGNEVAKHSWFSHDVTAAMLVPLNKETVATLVSQIDP